MTQAQATAAMRELRGLERAQAAIERFGADPCWLSVLKAIEWELRALRYVFSQEDARLVARADDLVRFEEQHPASAPQPAYAAPMAVLSADVPKPVVIH